ncbi:MAG: hypothetical protein M3548_01135 [Actinomycetota bacterium]|nr:hypothetical protein [Actinomycetota bacterium]
MAQRRDNRKKATKTTRLRVAAVLAHIVIGLTLTERVVDLFHQLKGLAG